MLSSSLSVTNNRNYCYTGVMVSSLNFSISGSIHKLCYDKIPCQGICMVLLSPFCHKFSNLSELWHQIKTALDESFQANNSIRVKTRLMREWK